MCGNGHVFEPVGPQRNGTIGPLNKLSRQKETTQ